MDLIFHKLRAAGYLAAFVLTILGQAQPASPAAHPWTVEDSVAVTYFERGEMGWNLLAPEQR